MVEQYINNDVFAQKKGEPISTLHAPQKNYSEKDEVL